MYLPYNPACPERTVFGLHPNFRLREIGSMSILGKITSSFACVLALMAVVASAASAQSIPVADAQPFLGAWTLSVEGTPLELNIVDAQGQVAADVIVMGTTSRVTQIAKAEESISLTWVADMQGQQAPITIRLTPQGTNLATVIDVADGMFTANATATRKP
jgi:hypothetical protein